LIFQKQISSHSTITELEPGIDFIFKHFVDYIEFPRKISTFNSEGAQFPVLSKNNLISSFTDSNFIDCRISAFPYLKENILWAPDLIFIDIDRKDFKNNINFENALHNTLKNIKKQLDGFPTVLETGGGYHIILPISCPMPLENITEFKEFDKPSEQFLRFAKDYFSNGKADKNNYPSFKSCLLRIPGSINSKYNKKVTIVQRWNGVRASITKNLLLEFKRYLKQKSRQKQLLNSVRKRSSNNNNYDPKYYEWIDYLLQTPIKDFRKLVIDLILVPYFINIRKLSYSESYTIIKNWLDKCNDLERLDNYRNFEYRINYGLKKAMNKGIGPMSKEKIKTDPAYTELYQILQTKEALNHV
jgi:hypothetical protein